MRQMVGLTSLRNDKLIIYSVTARTSVPISLSFHHLTWEVNEGFCSVHHNHFRDFLDEHHTMKAEGKGLKIQMQSKGNRIYIFWTFLPTCRFHPDGKSVGKKLPSWLKSAFPRRPLSQHPHRSLQECGLSLSAQTE